jgi:hypothetical protein
MIFNFWRCGCVWRGREDEDLLTKWYRALTAFGLPPVSLCSVRFGCFCLSVLCSTAQFKDSSRHIRGMRWRSWVRSCDKNRKVACSVPDGIIGIFHCLNPSGPAMALESTQPLTAASTRDLCWGKGGRWVLLTTLPLLCSDCIEILGTSTSCSPKDLSGPL